MTRTIQRLLIANRGEIARRILRTAHDMGISTVAIYADGDRDAPFVAEADVAISLAGKTSAETYLDTAKVLAAARASGADAIHPGYGFLSENAAIARAVEDAGLIWVGPGPEAIEAMGDKLSAKKRMQSAGVPTLPSAELGDHEDLAAAAESVGYPLLVKASAGGGGKGMRVVESAAQLQAAVEGARREAGASFGDDTVFLERWLASSRHVEIQLLGDLHGNLVHCFERECSIQRRHQKVIEEAPSSAVTEAVRARMGEAAVAAGKAIQYSSAGTVEFLLEGEGDDANFWFLEVNTRLQVEHPVTEEITGLDLVREQLRVAQGEELGFDQQDLRIDGHAIEARLYAEDPDNDFLPATGTVLAWQPSTRARARFDSGIETGSEIGIEFDPMLAKVIVHAPTRSEAALRLARVLETTRVQGLITNRDFLVATLRSPEFLAGDTTTDFIEKVTLPARREPSADQAATAAILVAMALQADRRAAATLVPGVPSGYRNSFMPPEDLRVVCGERELLVEYRISRDGSFLVTVDRGRAQRVTLLERRSSSEDSVTVEIAPVEKAPVEKAPVGGSAGPGIRHKATLTVDSAPTRPARYLVQTSAGDVELLQVRRFPFKEIDAVAGGLVAPMPGKVLSTHVAVGDQVEERQLLLILEAMKMEHRITAPHAGIVTELRVHEGEQVDNGALLVVLEEPEPA
jgi:propionyl-CoA carboxylase alpha chain